MPNDENAQPNTEQAASYPPRNDQIVPPSLSGSQPDAPHLGNIYQAADNQPEPISYWFQRPEWWLVITNVIFIAVGVSTAFIFYLQFREMKNATTNADANFRKDERAWMAFTFTGGNITFTVGKSFLIPTQLLNTGKTPARNVRGNIVVSVFDKGEYLDFDYTQGRRNTKFYTIEAGTVFPNGKFEESFESLQHGQTQIHASIITKAMLDAVLKGRSFIIVHGIITYADIFGTEHWTTYCRYVTNPSLISGECVRHNDTDNN